MYMFVLEITNGGAFTQNWFKNTKWSFDEPPTLTTSGTDILTFFTDDGGFTWYGVVSSKNLQSQTLYK